MKKQPKIENEAKDVKFKRLANQRTIKALRYIKAIGRLSNKSLYEYTPEQSEKIIEALAEAIKKTEAQLQHIKPQEELFSL